MGIVLRALCHEVPGPQTEHPQIDQLITECILAKEIYTVIKGEAYLNDSRLRNNTVYGTDNELAATTQILRRDIILFLYWEIKSISGCVTHPRRVWRQ